MVSTSVCTVRMSTTASGLVALICFVASTPFKLGMLMSMMTMSGRELLDHPQRFHAVPGLADHLEVRLLLQDVAQRPADQGMVVHQEDTDLSALGRLSDLWHHSAALRFEVRGAAGPAGRRRHDFNSSRDS